MNETKKKAPLFAWKYFYTDFMRVTSIPALIWFRPKRVYENENARKKISGGAILAANHATFFDPVYIMVVIWYRRHHFICAKELLVNRFMNFFLKTACLCIPIDRENFGVASFKSITDELKEGSLVAMFPEGGVNTAHDRSVNAFKSGIVLMALRAKVPIVPIYIAPRPHWYSRVRAAIGEPVYVDQIYGPRPTMQQINEIAELIHDREVMLESLIR